MYNSTFSDGKTHNQIDQTLTDGRWHSSIVDVQSFRGADCDTHHYLVVPKVRKILTVSKQAAQKLDGERFNLRTLNELEVRKQYQTEISNSFANLGNLSNGEDIKRVWENVKENNKNLSYRESRSGRIQAA